MSNIMQQSSKAYNFALTRGETELAGDFVSNVHYAQGMDEPSMLRTRKDPISNTKLLNTLESFKKHAIDYFFFSCRVVNKSVNVVKNSTDKCQITARIFHGC